MAEKKPQLLHKFKAKQFILNFIQKMPEILYAKCYYRQCIYCNKPINTTHMQLLKRCQAQQSMRLRAKVQIDEHSWEKNTSNKIHSFKSNHILEENILLFNLKFEMNQMLYDVKLK